LETLLTDPALKYFFFIGAYRKEDVDDENDGVGHHDGSQQSQSNHRRQNRRPISVSTTSVLTVESAVMDCLSKLEPKSVTIDVENLTVDELTEFVAAALHIDTTNDDDDDQLRRLREELVEAIYQRTKGNIFFTKQILEQMHREGLLEFSRLTFEWEWHLKGVNLDDLLSDKVLHAVTEKIRGLSPALQRVLTVAAYTRSTFDLDTLFQLLQDEKVMGGSTTDVSTPEKLVGMLDDAVLRSLLTNSTGSNTYRFEHDQIKKAAFGLIPRHERDQFRLSMGLKLVELEKCFKRDHSANCSYYRKEYVSSDADWMLFVAADHLNSASYMFRMRQKKMKDDSEKFILIRLNYRVGSLAASKAVFDSASTYLTLAMQELVRVDDDPWDERRVDDEKYQLTSSIYRLLADVELAQGKFDVGKKLAGQVLEKVRSLEDRLPTQLCKLYLFAW
jgi:predicted ATPase